MLEGEAMENSPVEPQPVEPQPIEPPPIEPQPIEPQPNELQSLKTQPESLNVKTQVTNDESLKKEILLIDYEAQPEKISPTDENKLAVDTPRNESSIEKSKEVKESHISYMESIQSSLAAAQSHIQVYYLLS